MERLFTGQDASAMREVPGEVDHQLHREIVSHYTLMRESAALEGIQLRLVSSWRSYEKQKSIWDRKTLGELPLLDSQGSPLDTSNLTHEEICQSILHWSALPGSSRHHWGTDFDVYDAAAMELSEVQLIPEEYQVGGPMEKLGTWLNKWLNSSENPGFYLPYSPGRETGYGDEPWHLSFGPFASYLQSEFKVQHLQDALEASAPRLLAWSSEQVQEFFDHYVIATSPFTEFQKTSQPIQLKMENIELGKSHLGSDIDLIQIQLPSSRDTHDISVLILGGHHGDESEGVQILQRCLENLKHADFSESNLTESQSSVGIISPLNPDGLKIGYRANSQGVDLNRNFPSTNWSDQLVELKASEDAPRIPTLSPGSEPASEIETQILIQTLKKVQPKLIVSTHSPLACVDQDIPGATDSQEDLEEAKWLSRVSGLPTTQSIGYPTPGSFGSYCKEQDIPLITLELEALPREELYQKWVPILTQFIQNQLLNPNSKEN